MFYLIKMNFRSNDICYVRFLFCLVFVYIFEGKIGRIKPLRIFATHILLMCLSDLCVILCVHERVRTKQRRIFCSLSRFVVGGGIVVCGISLVE